MHLRALGFHVSLVPWSCCVWDTTWRDHGKIKVRKKPQLFRHTWSSPNNHCIDYKGAVPTKPWPMHRWAWWATCPWGHKELDPIEWLNTHPHPCACPTLLFGKQISYFPASQVQRWREKFPQEGMYPELSYLILDDLDNEIWDFWAIDTCMRF